MKVLMVCDSIKGNGIASVVYRLYKSLKERGIKCDVACYQNLSICKDIYDEFCKDGNKLISVPRISNGIIDYVKNIRKVCADGNYDVVHIHTSLMIFLAAYCAKKEGVKVRVGHAHGSKFFNYPEIVLKFLEPIGRILNRKYCTKLVTCSQRSARYTFGTEGVFIPNYVSTKNIMSVSYDRIRELSKEYGCEGKIVLGYMGSLDGVKNVVFLPDIIAELKKRGIDVLLLLIGEGQMKYEIESKIDALNCRENIKLLGKKDNCNELVQIFDYYISASRSEGMSLSMIEAQMAGKPCIVSDLIPNDSDLGIGLFKKIMGFDTINWCNEIEKMINYEKKGITRDLAYERISQNELTEESIVKHLISVYTEN